MGDKVKLPRRATPSEGARPRPLIEYIEHYLRFEGAQGDMVSGLIDEKLDQLGDIYYLASYADRKEVVAELERLLPFAGGLRGEPDRRGRQTPAALTQRCCPLRNNRNRK